MTKEEVKEGRRSHCKKDQITLTNKKNGEQYKFSCKTCIDGHRAPLCDPKKHRGKILFRRPLPGRPARQCGHPKQNHCDCMAKRTLCCVLTNEQWDKVCKGESPSVFMFDSLEDLNAADAAHKRNAPSQHVLTQRPYAQSTTYPLLGSGGPQGNTVPGSAPFGWIAPQDPLSDHASIVLWDTPNGASHFQMTGAPMNSAGMLGFPQIQPFNGESNLQTDHRSQTWPSQPADQTFTPSSDSSASAHGLLETPSNNINLAMQGFQQPHGHYDQTLLQSHSGNYLPQHISGPTSASHAPMLESYNGRGSMSSPQAAGMENYDVSGPMSAPQVPLENYDSRSSMSAAQVPLGHDGLESMSAASVPPQQHDGRYSITMSAQYDARGSMSAPRVPFNSHDGRGSMSTPQVPLENYAGRGSISAHQTQVLEAYNGPAQFLPFREPQPNPAAQQNLQRSARPSNNCCSSRSRHSTVPGSSPQEMNQFRSAPSNQFPCGSCASTECTCTNCPPTMQYTDGAWNQACDRRGHRVDSGPSLQDSTSLSNGDFDNLFPQGPQQSSGAEGAPAPQVQVPSNPNFGHFLPQTLQQSSRTDVAPATPAQDSPFRQGRNGDAHFFTAQPFPFGQSPGTLDPNNNIDNDINNSIDNNINNNLDLDPAMFDISSFL